MTEIQSINSSQKSIFQATSDDIISKLIKVSTDLSNFVLKNPLSPDEQDSLNKVVYGLATQISGIKCAQIEPDVTDQEKTQLLNNALMSIKISEEYLSQSV